MARIFITGSADGLGQLSANLLAQQGHEVVLHARTMQRGEEAMRKVPGAERVLTGDLSNIGETIQLAEKVNASGSFDVVIHNAGVYQAAPKDVFTVNTLAPYVLTSLIEKPKRLIYLSSGMHLQGHPNLESFTGPNGRISYSDTKLHVVMLSLAAAKVWPDVYSNAVDPGWVPTRMGGHGAPDDLQQGYETQAWLAASNDPGAKVSGRYFHHQKERRYHPAADQAAVREKFLMRCEEITGVAFPGKG